MTCSHKRFDIFHARKQSFEEHLRVFPKNVKKVIQVFYQTQSLIPKPVPVNVCQLFMRSYLNN